MSSAYRLTAASRDRGLRKTKQSMTFSLSRQGRRWAIAHPDENTRFVWRCAAVSGSPGQPGVEPRLGGRERSPITCRTTRTRTFLTKPAVVRRILEHLLLPAVIVSHARGGDRRPPRWR